MLDLFGNHIVGFPTRRLNFIFTTRSRACYQHDYDCGTHPFVSTISHGKCGSLFSVGAV